MHRIKFNNYNMHFGLNVMIINKSYYLSTNILQIVRILNN